MNNFFVSCFTKLTSYYILAICVIPIANDDGVFKAEIEPVTLTIKKKQVEVSVDEHPRPQTTLEGLKKLPPVFKKEGLVTAGSASVSSFYGPLFPLYMFFRIE